MLHEVVTLYIEVHGGKSVKLYCLNILYFNNVPLAIATTIPIYI